MCDLASCDGKSLDRLDGEFLDLVCELEQALMST